MKIYSVYDPEFKEFGHVIDGYEKECEKIVEALNEYTPLPEGVDYVPEEAALQSLTEAEVLSRTIFGGIPAQFGWCNGHNTKLNCLEYHRSSEFNLGTEDFVLILAKQSDMENFKLDSSKAMAFRVPKGVLVEVYATSLHYAPCHTDPDKGFRVLVALPKGTNVGTTKTENKTSEDKLLWASNKWLIAHPESSEASQGAFVGITGENLDIAKDI
ncbi:DUF4867 family protein [Butyrivibrio sp. NC3005]|jgi:hypothetical protein|uniref:DUF4867 family protein n=1 Tax=Butyrivibrio sp. NC3005 TaxID=1280685 RepID=UPI0004014EF0|nr:DUF4867 family protein [Butyrivibrio sp. NC3005]